jgi:hypothetical protein
VDFVSLEVVDSRPSRLGMLASTGGGWAEFSTCGRRTRAELAA